ncbi:sensor histidine kinase [Streptomyces sp. NBC_00572]|uniref:sensor histidine kinase n=1 Tax=Streptomyces sp. NBC_00572 TaxID=2903664 RepID=UPI0022534D76|nr:histidine kinase [Streptomyces sp. NBC_00572]MCX4982440.1 histidine kinase [Streptomyces sp. NBC_00572]
MPATTRSTNTPTATPVPGGRAVTVLAWCAALAHPFVLFSGVQAGPFRSTELRLFLSAVAVGLLLPLVRRRPEAALGLLLVGLCAASTTRPSAELTYLPVLAADACVGRLAARRPLRSALSAAAVTLTVQIFSALYTTSGQDVFVTTVVALALALLTAGLLGHSFRERRAHAAELRARTAAEAVTAERLRIARELHDVIAHSIGVIAIQAGVGRRVIDTQPAEARNALATIETTSRETLAGLRRTLGALRASAKDTEGPGSGAAPAPRDPAPGLADLDRLVASTADAGVRVEVRHLGDPGRSLPPEVDLAAYRIVQESLTNVVRHAGTPTCRVTVDRGEDTLLIEITDDGDRADGSGDGVGGGDGGGDRAGDGLGKPRPAARAGTAASAVPAGPGYGIVGMSERAALLGGRFSASPRPNGGFHVTAALPLPLPLPLPQSRPTPPHLPAREGTPTP